MICMICVILERSISAIEQYFNTFTLQKIMLLFSIFVLFSYKYLESRLHLLDK